MRAVFGEQKRAGDSEKAKQHETRARSQKALWSIVAADRSVVKRHDVFRFHHGRDEKPVAEIQCQGIFDRVPVGRDRPIRAPLR